MIRIHHILTTKSHFQRQKRGAFEFRYTSTTRRPNFIHGRYPRSFLGPIRPRTWLTVFCHFIKSNSTSLYYPSFQSPFTTRFIRLPCSRQCTKVRIRIQQLYPLSFSYHRITNVSPTMTLREHHKYGFKIFRL
jgi:hypothetical protein